MNTYSEELKRLTQLLIKEGAEVPEELCLSVYNYTRWKAERLHNSTFEPVLREFLEDIEVYIDKSPENKNRMLAIAARLQVSSGSG